MKVLLLPPQKYLRTLFEYDRRTGLLRWKARPPEHFCRTKEWKRWNTCFAGKEAGKFVPKSGHRIVYIDGRGYLAHRLIWKLVTGHDPKGLVDHKNRKGFVNAWKNLREANDSQSTMNRRKFKNNTSGHVGVTWSSQHRCWRANIQVNRKRIEIGLFDDLKEASFARRQAELMYHGEYAR